MSLPMCWVPSINAFEFWFKNPVIFCNHWKSHMDEKLLCNRCVEYNEHDNFIWSKKLCGKVDQNYSTVAAASICTRKFEKLLKPELKAKQYSN